MKRLVLLAALAACGHTAAGGSDPGDGKPALTITSSAFAASASIPQVHTCQGEDLSPPLAWSGAPAGTQSYALIVDDPDAPDPAAPKRTHVHWVLADIPAATTALVAGAAPAGAVAGKNDNGNAGWNGPCPPIGRHRYFFKVYALDTAHLGAPGITKPELLAAMTGHVLARGELIGTYEKTK